MNIPDSQQKSKGSSYHRLNPYPAKLLERYTLNKQGSTKENFHIVVDLHDSEIQYQIGCSFGLYPENSPRYVSEVLETLKNASADTIVLHTRSGLLLPLAQLLTKKVNISMLSSAHIKLIQQYAPHPLLEELLNDKAKLTAFTAQNNLATLLAAFWTADIPLQALCDILPPMMPRYYSIASSQKKVGNQAHFMIASFDYPEAGRKKRSVMAEYLIDHCEIGSSTIPLFMQENPHFTLPQNSATPVIMIGPGTGLAAFRGFLQEREHQTSPGKSWLFTGDRHEAYDFYYKEEYTPLLQQGLLRLDLAFSRDNDEKTYVQHKMQAQGALLWSWIQNEGAHIYISGDASSMAKDVQRALHTIAEKHGDLSPEEAAAFWKQQRKERRLLLDIY